MTYFNSNLLSKSLFIFSLLLIVAFVSSYIIQIQNLTRDYYQTKIYQKEVNQLTASVQHLDNQYQTSTSLAQLLPKIEKLGLVKIENLAYLDLSSNQMAVK